MKKPPIDPPSLGGETDEVALRPGDADSRTPWLPDLIRQREEFAHDVTRLEAALARDDAENSAAYERLLRCRRISEKLENRIELVRIQQKRQVGR